MPDSYFQYGDMNFVWDDEKNAHNIEKHKVSFETATHVFKDAYRLDYYDEENSIEEDRYNTIGLVGDILFVVYSDRQINKTDYIRIISARPAYGWEKDAYNDNITGRRR